MSTIQFVVPGQPVAKGRPRFARRGKAVIAYTPAKTANYENLVSMVAQVAMAGRAPTERPLQLDINIGLQVPASWSKKRQALAMDGSIRATKKPDADNILKGIKDGCNGIVWRDDAQVVVITLRKDYAESPGVAIMVKELDGEAA